LNVEDERSSVVNDPEDAIRVVMFAFVEYRFVILPFMQPVRVGAVRVPIEAVVQSVSAPIEAAVQSVIDTIDALAHPIRLGAVRFTIVPLVEIRLFIFALEIS
jgi:hypothetical protein